MDRRAFLGILAGGVLAAPLAVEAQQPGKVYRVAYVNTITPLSEMMGPRPINLHLGMFLDAMGELGYVEAQNLILERRSLEGRLENAPNLLAEFVRLKVDVIVCFANNFARAAKEANTTIPIVMWGAAAPVESGLVASLARPGGNITGISSDLGGDLHAKRLELLKEAVPGISRVAYLSHPRGWDSATGQRVRAMARSLGLTIFLAGITDSDVTLAFPIITREHADAILVQGSVPTYRHRRRIIEFANVSRLPVGFVFREAVYEGALIFYGLNDTELLRLAAVYVDKILKGSHPRDLPIQQPSKFDLIVNLKTAKAIGLTIPPSLLQRADQVIE